MRDLALRREFARFGVHMLDNAVYAEDAWRDDYTIAMDAQPQLITTANAGIPAFLANILDPQVIDVIIGPLRAAEIAGGEVKKGDWTTQSIMMPLAESVGHVVAYGDYDNGGTIDANVDWVSRQPFHYQTFKMMGERQVAQWGLAGIDWNARLDIARAQTFARFQNNSYFYGINGLQNYGMLNDPSLITPIVPNTKAAGGTAWTNATANEEYEDVLKLYGQLQTQMGGNLEMTDRMILAISTIRQPLLAKLSPFNVSVSQMLRENFPNLTIMAAPQYTTGGGELLQLIVPDYEGVETTWAAFTEKLRAHPIVQEASAWKQKLSAGTWGAIIRRPICVAQMLGV